MWLRPSSDCDHQLRLLTSWQSTSPARITWFFGCLAVRFFGSMSCFSFVWFPCFDSLVTRTPYLANSLNLSDKRTAKSLIDKDCNSRTCLGSQTHLLWHNLNPNRCWSNPEPLQVAGFLGFLGFLKKPTKLKKRVQTSWSPEASANGLLGR